MNHEKLTELLTDKADLLHKLEAAEGELAKWSEQVVGLMAKRDAVDRMINACLKETVEQIRVS